MKKNLFEGEEIVRTWSNCTLTNKRVWQQIEGGGQFEYRGFPLSNFQGAIIGRSSHPWLLYIGIAICSLSFLMILFSSENKAGSFGLMAIGFIFLGVWHALKRASISITSGEVEIVETLHGNQEDFQAAAAFVSEVERIATQSKKLAESTAA